MKLLVALDEDDIDGGKAHGQLFWDDGISKGTVLQHFLILQLNVN